MAESATPPPSEKKPEPAPCEEGYHRDPETGECVPDEEEKPGESPAEAEKMYQAVRGVIKDALEKVRAEVRAGTDQIVKEELAKIQQQFATGLRKELGLSTDPTVTKSELNSAIRTAMLDLKVEGKRTPASGLTKGPEGTGKPEHPVDKLLKEYQGEAS